MNLLTIEHLKKSYTERLLFDDTAFSINEGEKVGLIGINGTGKSTLLRIAAGLEEPDDGSVVKGRSLYIRYLPQIPEFESGENVLEAIVRENKNEPHFASGEELKAAARSMLNRLEILDGEAKIDTLSGGQRKRVALASVLLSTADLLILDEPTNHLDSGMAEWLEAYLKSFKGALLMITHDRYFLDSVTNRIVELDKGKLYSYQGGYEKYLELKAERMEMAEAGMLVQAFIPTARDITVKITSTGKTYQMELADDAGFFAALIPRKTMADYTLLVFYDNGTLGEIHDPYSFAPQFTDADLKKFEAGIHYGIYNKMGAHPMTVKGTAGVYFAVWAPCAMRVSVVGDFNLWDGRRHQMRKLGESGIFEIFIPGVKKGAVYKYEVKFKNGDPALKADPYANYAELRPNTASVVWDLNEYQWNDGEWMDKRAKTDTKTAPMSVYEVHLGSWMRKETKTDDTGDRKSVV